MRQTRIPALVILLLGLPLVLAAETSKMPDFLNEEKPRAKILLLGMFHFSDAGLDAHKPGHGFDTMSEKRQKEIAAVLEMLAEYRPTKIAVEIKAGDQPALDESYAGYLGGEKELSPNETHQIGFRLGRMLEHKKLYAVDAEQRSYFPDMTEEQYMERVGSLLEGVDPARIEAEQAWDTRYEKLYDWEDGLVDRQSLQEHILFMNDPATLRRHHGHYLVGSFKLGRDDDYFGADMKTAWYNRNLRIFQNLQRIATGPGERILLVIGSGHVPIIHQAVISSPEYELVQVDQVIRAK